MVSFFYSNFIGKERITRGKQVYIISFSAAIKNNYLGRNRAEDGEANGDGN